MNKKESIRNFPELAKNTDINPRILIKDADINEVEKAKKK
jgi:hypothetical protein|tara:strand:+ start:16 stop:135 length:120 start_codon:yes stop_codon:yes gene_type:complete